MTRAGLKVRGVPRVERGVIVGRDIIHTRALPEPMKRQTEQRRAIRECLEEAGRPLSAQEVLEAAQDQVTGLGIATVYRNLKALVDQGFLIPVDLPGEPSRYELAAQGHHHHFQCRGCERVFDVRGCFKALEQNLPPGFLAEDHEVVIYGRCADCVSSAAI